MPNLVGIWKPDLAEAAVRATLARQLERVRAGPARFTDHIAACDGFGMALQDHGLLENGVQPAASDDGNLLLLLDGEISNREELQQRFRAELPPGSLSAPELCLRLLQGRGVQAASLLNGLFSIALYDRAANRISLIADRYGARALFYSSDARALAFGSELKAVAVAQAADRKIDQTGVLELLAYGTHFMERTWMEGCHRLPPGTVLTMGPEGMRTQEYWTYGFDESAPRYDQQTYATVFGILLDRAVERAMAGSKRIGVFLSGGYDSRSVAAALRPHRRPLPAFTFGQPESRDVRFAAMLAQRLGLEHQALSPCGPYLYPHCRAIVWRTEGMIAFSNATSIQWHDLFAQRMDIILTGFLGEFSGSHTWPKLLLARSRAAAVDAIFERFLRAGLRAARPLLHAPVYARAEEEARLRFARSFDALRNDHPMDLADAWNFRYLQPRGTFQAPAVDRHRFEMRAPHTDNDLVDFLLTIRPRDRIEQRVYKKMIAYSFPQIRDIPCTNSARPVAPGFAGEYARMVADYAVRKVSASLPRRPPASALGREFRDVAADFRAEPQLRDELLRPLLRDDVLPQSIFDHAAIERLVKEHYEQGASHERPLALIMSLGLALKYFLHDEIGDVPGAVHAR